MARRGQFQSEEHRRAVGQGVSRAWQRRYKDGFTPKSPTGKLAHIARLLKVDVDRVVECVEMLRGNHVEMCASLQECVQRHKLGLGGERVDQVVIAELDRMKGH